MTRVDRYEPPQYNFEVWQDENMEASGYAPTLDEAIAEANHYAAMYSQDGRVSLRFFETRELILLGVT